MSDRGAWRRSFLSANKRAGEESPGKKGGGQVAGIDAGGRCHVEGGGKHTVGPSRGGKKATMKRRRGGERLKIQLYKGANKNRLVPSNYLRWCYMGALLLTITESKILKRKKQYQDSCAKLKWRGPEGGEE